MGFKLIKEIKELNDIDAYVGVYLPMAGWKSVLLSRDWDCDNEFTPWNTGFFGYETKWEAVVDALMWAVAEDIPLHVGELSFEEEEKLNKMIENYNKREER